MLPYTHFLKNVTLSCPTSGMLPRAACHWLTHNFQNHSLPLIGWHSLPLILFSHQPRPVHWTCSVATWIVGLTGTNFPSHFVPKIKSVLVEITLTWHSIKTPCPFSECWKCHEISWTPLPLPSTPHHHCELLPPSSSRTLTTLWSSKWIREEWLDYYDT